MAINFPKPSENSNKDYSPLPQGRYDFRVEKAELRESQAGNQVINVQFKVASGEKKGRKVYRTFALTPNSVWAIQEFAIAANFEKAKTGGMVSEKELLDYLNGSHPLVNAFTEPTNGRDNLKGFKEIEGPVQSLSYEDDLPSFGSDNDDSSEGIFG